MSPELVELALRKQRLQIRSADQRAAMIHHARGIQPVFRKIDTVIDGVLWMRDHARIVTGIGIFALIARPRAAVRWLRRGWLGWQLIRRARVLVS